MGKLFLQLIFVLVSIQITAQNTKAQFISNNKEFESVTKFNPNFEIEFIDERRYVYNNISFELINNYLNEILESFQAILINNKTIQLKNKKISVIVDFFNFIESSSQKLILKGIVKVKLDGADYSDLNNEFIVNDELFTKLKFKDLNKDKQLAKVNNAVDEFSKRLSSKISNKIIESLKNENHYVFSVTSIGVAKLMDDEELAIKEATLDALRNGSTMAFGTNIFNQSEIVDYGSVTDIVRAESSGNVLDYQIDNNKMVFTDDGYCCVVVKSLMRKNEIKN